MKIRRLFSVLLLTPLAIACASCVLPFGDCWPDVTADVRLNPDLSPVSSDLIVSAALRIGEADVVGVDGEGVPIGRDLTPFVVESALSGSFEFRGLPVPSWYVAFLDANGNRLLDSGELFGVDTLNPRPGTCDNYTTAIEISRARGAN